MLHLAAYCKKMILETVKKLYPMKIAQLFAFLFFSSLVWGQSNSTTTKITLDHNLIYIPIQINGSRTLNFLFDTGAEVTVLDKKVANEIQLEVTGKSRIGTAGKTIDATTSSLNKLTVGDFSLDSQSIEILSIQHLSDHLNIQIDGVIGYDLLKKYVITTNLDQLNFILQDPNAFMPGDQGLKFEKVDLAHHHFGLPLKIKFHKHSQPVTLVFKYDTGFPDHLSFHNSTVEKYQLLKKGKLKERKGFGADNTLTTNLRSKIHEVSLGSASCKNIKVIYEVDPISVAPTKNAIEAGLVGQEILNQFNITYNYPGGMVYMVPRK